MVVPLTLTAPAEPATTDARQMLEQLRDIQLPLPTSATESMSPPILLLGLAAILVAALLLAWRWRHRQLHSALARLRQITCRFQQDDDALALASAINALLRQQARLRDPDPSVPSLVGQHWRSYLERRSGGAIPDHAALLLMEGPYLPRRPSSPDAAPALLAYAEAWLRANLR